MITLSRDQLVNERYAAVLDPFPGEHFNLVVATTVKPDRVRNAASNITNTFVLELSYQYAPSAVPPNNLDLKIDVPVMIIWNVLHLTLVTGKLFVVVNVDKCTM